MNVDIKRKTALNHNGISRIGLVLILLLILIVASAASISFAISLFKHNSIKTSNTTQDSATTSSNVLTSRNSSTISSSQITSTSENNTSHSLTSSGETGINVSLTFSFNNTSAKHFLESLDTPIGLLKTFNVSKQIYIADDQALDYAALVKLGNQSLANKINSSMNYYGGLYAYWNAVFVILNHFPATWNFSFPLDYGLGTRGTYAINVTRFTHRSSFQDYLNYTDLLLFYSLDMLHARNYTQAVNAFVNANKYWNGIGFADIVYNSSTSAGYSSYKLAVDLIVYKALLANPNTEPQAASYNFTITQVETMMSKLQGSDGGVITNYQLVNGDIQIPPNTYENGETTSLFVLAK